MSEDLDDPTAWIRDRIAADLSVGEQALARSRAAEVEHLARALQAAARTKYSWPKLRRSRRDSWRDQAVRVLRELDELRRDDSP